MLIELRRLVSFCDHTEDCFMLRVIDKCQNVLCANSRVRRCVLTAVVLAWSVATISLAGPTLDCSVPHHDFGVVWDRNIVSHQFKVRNIGDEALLITKVRSDCGCTTAHLRKKQLSPGEQMDIDVQFSLAGLSSVKQKTIYVYSNDSGQPCYKLTLAATIRRSIELSSEELTFSALQKEVETEKKVHIRFTSSESHHVMSPVTSNISFCETRLTTIETGREYMVSAQLHADDIPEGLTRGEIVINTDHPDYPSLSVPVIVQAPRDVCAIPSRLLLATGDGESLPMTRSILVRSSRNQPFSILDVSFPDDRSSVSIQRLRPTLYRLRVADLFPSAGGSALKIRIRKADGEEKAFEVPVISGAQSLSKASLSPSRQRGIKSLPVRSPQPSPPVGSKKSSGRESIDSGSVFRGDDGL
jgi:hypothetical protein